MIYIILPIYNEADVIAKLLRRIDKEMKNNSFKYEVLAINDGSTDNTADIIESHQNMFPIDLIDFEVNRGVGEVFRCGFEKILNKAQDEDTVITMDADNTHDPQIIKMMQDKLNEGCDVVIASCLKREAKLVGVPFLRR